MSSARLHNLLRDGIKYAPLYKPVFNSDHLPMALAAMHGLGAEDLALQQFRDDYSKRLQPWEASEPVTDWRSNLGNRRVYPALLDFFRQQIELHGQQLVLEEVLATTLQGVALDAFHPVIRLGYAVEFDTPEEVAAALAYMVTAHRDMPFSTTSVDLRSQLEAQVSQGALTLEANRFTASLEELVAQEIYPVGTAATLAEVAAVALDVYLATRNFFALHLVTSTQAIRCAVPSDLQEHAIACQTGAILASHLVLQSPSISKPVPVPDQLDPEHALKYAWSCVSEYRAYGDGRYVDEIRAFRDKGLVPEWVARDLLSEAD